MPVRRRRKGERGRRLARPNRDGLSRQVGTGEGCAWRQKRVTEREREARAEQVGGEGKNLSIAAAVCPAACVYLASVFLRIIFFLSSFLLTRSSPSRLRYKPS